VEALKAKFANLNEDNLISTTKDLCHFVALPKGRKEVRESLCEQIISWCASFCCPLDDRAVLKKSPFRKPRSLQVLIDVWSQVKLPSCENTFKWVDCLLALLSRANSDVYVVKMCFAMLLIIIEKFKELLKKYQSPDDSEKLESPDLTTSPIVDGEKLEEDLNGSPTPDDVQQYRRAFSNSKLLERCYFHATSENEDNQILALHAFLSCIKFYSDIKVTKLDPGVMRQISQFQFYRKVEMLNPEAKNLMDIICTTYGDKSSQATVTQPEKIVDLHLKADSTHLPLEQDSIVPLGREVINLTSKCVLVETKFRVPFKGKLVYKIKQHRTANIKLGWRAYDRSGAKIKDFKLHDMHLLHSGTPVARFLDANKKNCKDC